MPRHWTGTPANGCSGCGHDFTSRHFSTPIEQASMSTHSNKDSRSTHPERTAGVVLILTR